MQIFRFILLFILIMPVFTASSQNKKTLNHDSYKEWNRIKQESISNNGQYIQYTLNANAEADDLINLHLSSGRKILSHLRGTNGSFSFNSDFFFFTIKPAIDSVKNMKRRKVKEEDLPMDSLAIVRLSDNSIQKISRIESYKTPKKWSNWFAYLSRPLPDTANKKNQKKDVQDLTIRQMNGSKSFHYPAVTSYTLAETGGTISFTSSGNDSTFVAGVYVFDTNEEKLIPVYRSKGKYSSSKFSKQGDKLSFVSDIDTTKALIRPYQLHLWQKGQDSVKTIATPDSPQLIEKWLVSEHYENVFSEDGKKLFFGLKPYPVLQDTSLVDSEIVNVEVWHYEDPRLYTQQKIEKEKDLKKAYASVYDLSSQSFVQLASEEIPEINLSKEGNGIYHLAFTSMPYMKQISWEGFPVGTDAYIINEQNGSGKLIKKKIMGNVNLSPAGKFAFWYDYKDSSWFTYEIAGEVIRKNTDNSTVPYFNELNDSPNYPFPYGVAGWSENDEHILIYDRYDIWQIDPFNKTAPVNLTKNGRKEKINYRYSKLDEEEKFLKKGQKLILNAFYETDKSSAYFEMNYKSKSKMKKLIAGDFRLNNLKKLT